MATRHFLKVYCTLGCLLFKAEPKYNVNWELWHKNRILITRKTVLWNQCERVRASYKVVSANLYWYCMYSNEPGWLCLWVENSKEYVTPIGVRDANLNTDKRMLNSCHLWKWSIDCDNYEATFSELLSVSKPVTKEFLEQTNNLLFK